MKEEFQLQGNTLASWQGGWESVNGNPDIYIFQGYSGSYYLLAYNYDKDYGRGSFSCYEIESDENGCYVRIGIKSCRMTPEESPYGLHIAGWGSYMQS